MFTYVTIYTISMYMLEMLTIPYQAAESPPRTFTILLLDKHIAIQSQSQV